MRPRLALRQERAIERAYRRHVADLYRYSVAVLDDAAEAEEVVRTTFLSAYLRLGRRKRTSLHLNALLGIAHDLCRRRASDASSAEPRTQDQGLVCDQAARAISRQLDDRLPPDEVRSLRSHLRACVDCERFERSLHAQREALRALATMPVPESLQPSKRRGLRARPVRKFLPLRASF
jgi:DNA-directed RNA polymerase specialized sigma24 family protein